MSYKNTKRSDQEHESYKFNPEKWHNRQVPTKMIGAGLDMSGPAQVLYVSLKYICIF